MKSKIILQAMVCLQNMETSYRHQNTTRQTSATLLLPECHGETCAFKKLLFKHFTCKYLIRAASAEVLLQLLLLVAFRSSI